MTRGSRRNHSSRASGHRSVDFKAEGWQLPRSAATDDAGELEFVQVDHLGSPAAAAYTDGDSVGSATYYPFGDVRNSTGTFGTERGFTGQITDAGTGLNFYNARYLSTGIGRFIGPDSIIPNPSDPRDHPFDRLRAGNRYTYVRNNPLKYTDLAENSPNSRYPLPICSVHRRARLSPVSTRNKEKGQGDSFVSSG